jgi:uncharacterized repeat protein (TIGR03803 family)
MSPTRLLAILTLAAGAMPLPAIATSPLTTIYSFKGGSDGGGPEAGIVAPGGIFYGTTDEGDGKACPHALIPSGCGSVFTLNLTTGAEQPLHGFKPNANGQGPQPVAILDSAGMLYGVNRGSMPEYGNIFRLDPQTHHLAVLHTFTDGNDGGYPNAGLVAAGGALFGTTTEGGGADCGDGDACGVVFRMDTKTGTETVLHAFTGGADGNSPAAGVVYVNGALYGTTEFGGGTTSCSSGAGCGTLFKVDMKTGAETVLYSFQGGTDAAFPGALTYHDGVLYGTSTVGGTGCSYGCGTVFKFNIGTGEETVLYRFQGHVESSPQNGLIYHGGALYGIDEGGLANCYHGTTCGYIFKVDAATGVEKVLYTFTGAADGGGPENLIYSQDALYGTAYFGGLFNGKCLIFGQADVGCGTVFKLTP